MTDNLNEQSILLALGVLQPANAAEIRGFIKEAFPAAPFVPSVSEFENFLNSLADNSGLALRVLGKNGALFALTHKGNLQLSRGARKTRDKLRCYLLRDAHRRKFTLSRAELAKELAGDSPASDKRLAIKGGEANAVAPATPGQQRWPRLSRQFRETGSLPSARDTFLPLLSFLDTRQVAQASGKRVEEFEFDLVSLGTCIGISPTLLMYFVRNSQSNYREFPLRKRGGRRADNSQSARIS